jgi:hypothetical protein
LVEEKFPFAWDDGADGDLVKVPASGEVCEGFLGHERGGDAFDFEESRIIGETQFCERVAIVDE